jgi:uncharacterized glyoxalase superfamily protein PhnB
MSTKKRKATKKAKKKAKIFKPPSLTIQLSKEDMSKVKEAVKKAGVKSAMVLAKTALLEKVNSILSEEKPAEATPT